jgi:hypothetical protein
MSESQVILDDLRYIAACKRTVTLITNFRGVTIQLSAFVIQISQSNQRVRLRVNHRQVTALKVADLVLVQSDLFAKTVMAEIAQVHHRSQVVVLENLHYAIGSIGQRKNMRVQPEKPILVEMVSAHGFSLLGEMIDLSLNGLSVKLPANNLPTRDFLAPETPVEIYLGLPEHGGGIHDLKLSAKVAYTKTNNQICRIGLLTSPVEADQQVIRHYIFDRQTEILNEIQQMNRNLMKMEHR